MLDEKFFAALAHELRGPLNAITGWANALRSGSSDPDMVSQAVDAIERSVRSEAEMVERLVELWGLMEGPRRVERQVVDLAAIVRGALEGARPAAHARQVTVASALDAPTFPVLGEPAAVGRVVSAMLAYAIDRSPPGAAVDVRLEQGRARARVSVSDLGERIEAHETAHLFAPYRQSAASGPGHVTLNMNLAIAALLMSGLGGEITARATPDAPGLTMTVHLPLADDTAVAAGSAAARNPRDG
jgi:signal transduction histidine kinase